MNKRAVAWRALLFTACASVALLSAHAEDRHPGIQRPAASSLAPAHLPVTPLTEPEGNYGLRIRFRYLATLNANLEVRRRQYSIDDNLKIERPRTSIAWTMRWWF